VIRVATASRVCSAISNGTARWGRLLHDNRAGRDPGALDNVVDTESDQIATAQLAFDAEVE
jgi:hypothetical protein